MSATTTPASAALGSYAATIQYSPELMVRAQRGRTWQKKLTGKIPDAVASMSGKSETAHGYPVVQVFDFSKGRDGDRVTCDIVNRIKGAPTMGDKIAKDKGSPISIERDEIVINQARKPIDAGGRMSQQRTPHDLRRLAMGLGVSYIQNYEDNMFHVHAAGARGYQVGDEWVVPLASDPDFAEVCINPVLPPTYNRKFYPGSATSLANLANTNVLTLNFFDDLYTRVVTGSSPIKGVQMDDQGWGGDPASPMFLAIVSEAGWNSMMKEASGQNWRTFLSSANERLAYRQHPLFKNVEMGLWRNIAIMHTARAITFPETTTASEYDSSNVVQTVTVSSGVNAHRGILLGAEALGLAYGSWKPINLGGNNQGSGMLENLGSYGWVEEVSDFGNNLQFCVGMQTGVKKLVYSPGGVVTDNGVAAFDYHAPA